MKTKLEGAKATAKKTSDNFHLHNSIMEGNLDAAIHYCKNTNADNIFLIDCHNEKGDTPLICAINASNEEIVDILLQSGAPDCNNISTISSLLAFIAHINGVSPFSLWQSMRKILSAFVFLQ